MQQLKHILLNNNNKSICMIKENNRIMPLFLCMYVCKRQKNESNIYKSSKDETKII